METLIAGGLAEGWIPLPTAGQDNVYFYNIKSRCSRWTAPPQTYVEPDRVRVKHILIKHKEVRNPESKGQHKGPVDRTKQVAEEKAEETRRYLLENPEKWDDVAMEKSDDNSYNRGGDLGFNVREAWHKEFSDAAFALAVGEISGVIGTSSGYHIILRVE